MEPPLYTLLLLYPYAQYSVNIGGKKSRILTINVCVRDKRHLLYLTYESLRTKECVANVTKLRGDLAVNEDKLIVETRQLCKNFGPTIALNHVDLKVYRGQITGLIGEMAPVNLRLRPFWPVCSRLPAERSIIKVNFTRSPP